MSGALVVGIIAGLVALDLLIHVVFALLVLPLLERKPPFGVEPAPRDPGAEPVGIPTTHGLTLRGSLYQHADRPPRGLILFCPELGGDRFSAMSYCAGLWDAGFDILAFDFRNQGDSDRMPGYSPLHWLTEYEVADVLSAIGYIRRREDLCSLPLGLFGISRGGCAALVAAARCRDVECVAVEGVFSTSSLLLHFALRWGTLYVPGWLLRPVPLWHFRVTLALARRLSQLRRQCRYTILERWLPRLRDRRVLWIADAEDTYVPPQVSEMLCEKIGGDRCGFWLVPGAKHNMARPVNPEAYDARLVQLFSRLAPAGSEQITRANR